MAVSEPERLTLTFPEGLIGCPDWRAFWLEAAPEHAPVAVLRSQDEPSLSFIVVDPRHVDPAYALEPAPADLAALGAAWPDELAALVILTVDVLPFRVTANLLGPLLLNPALGRGRQVIQAGGDYSAQHPVGSLARRLTFADGLIGCPDWREFVLRPSPGAAPVQLLVSLDAADVALPVIDPRLVVPEYAPRLGAADLAALGAGEADLDWLCVVSVPAKPQPVTVNLLGPLVYNRRSGLARQVILSQSGYSATHAVGVGPGEVDHAGSNAPA